MIKIIVASLPDKSEDCPFAISCKWDNMCLPNCLLKHNDTLRNPHEEFNYTQTCYTCNTKTCPFLTTTHVCL